jgi:hypothetical protein
MSSVHNALKKLQSKKPDQEPGRGRSYLDLYPQKTPTMESFSKWFGLGGICLVIAGLGIAIWAAFLFLRTGKYDNGVGLETPAQFSMDTQLTVFSTNFSTHATVGSAGIVNCTPTQMLEDVVQRTSAVLSNTSSNVDGFTFRLQGIVWGYGQPSAVINGKVLREGEKYRGYLVERILPTKVMLRSEQGQLIELEFE